MLKLGPNVPMAMLQFSFSNREAVPPGLEPDGEETREEQDLRKSAAGGRMVIAPQERVSIFSLYDHLDRLGYELISGGCKLRINDRNRYNGPYPAVRFTFRRKEYRPEPGDAEWAKRLKAKNALTFLCLSAFWRMRAFLNPLTALGDEPVEGKSWASFNFEARVPRFLPTGDPVVIWKRDPEGNKIGERAEQIRPEKRLALSLCGAFDLADPS